MSVRLMREPVTSMRSRVVALSAGPGCFLRAGKSRGQGKRDADGQKAALHRGVAMSHLFSLRMIVGVAIVSGALKRLGTLRPGAREALRRATGAFAALGGECGVGKAHERMERNSQDMQKARAESARALAAGMEA